MRYSTKLCIGAFSLLALSSLANATTFRFDTDPFAGTNVLNAPGRQIVGGESFINFNIATDVFSIESTVFGISGILNFANTAPSNLPSNAGLNVIVVEAFDDDNNPLTPFGAGNAANLIAGRVTTPGPGLFIYFNQSLDLPRLVYSSDLSSQNSDLRILARMLNLNGANGRNAMPTFSAANFEITTATPEPSSALLLAPVLGGWAVMTWRRRKVGAAQPDTI